MDRTMSLVTFKIGSEFYGIDIMEVREIFSLLEITPIPNSPSFVDGVINLRGEIIPIVDLGKRFNFELKIFSEEEALLRGIVIINVDEMVIGVVIDQVNRVISINLEDVQPPPQVIAGIGAEYIQGVLKTEENLLIILNVKKLFSKQELLMLSATRK